MLRESRQLMDKKGLDRRSFLKVSGMLGIGLAASPIGAPLAEAVKFDRYLHKVSKSREGLGTIVSITALGPSEDQSEEAISMAFEEIERLSKIMSRFDPGTPLARINHKGFLDDVPPELVLIIEKSRYYYNVSNGIFDITVKPLLDLLEKESIGSKNSLPDREKIAETLKLVDARLIRVNGKSISLQKEGMGVTLDGIAKGYIVDRAAEKLAEKGIKHALLNAGGDIRTIGDKGNNKPWKIAIRDPFRNSKYPDIVAITNRSIATSGNYEIFFDKEKVFHHIINPGSGVSPQINSSVSVQARTAMEADALSTALFILNPPEGTKLINCFPMCDSLIITRGNQKFKSKGWHGIRI